MCLFALCYRKQSQVVYFVVYVDDIITGSSSPLTPQNTTKLHATFSLMVHAHLDYFLVLEIKYLLDKFILITQQIYFRLVSQNTYY